MDRLFSIQMPAGQFLKNVLLFSILALLPILLLYVSLAPGFAPALVEGGPRLGRFLRQVLTNGLPVIFTVNYFSFFLFAIAQQPTGRHRDTAYLVLLDIAARVILFLSLHALIYVLSVDWFGSFGGSRATALSVVAPTLARSAYFENISGVYLYATMISAFPLYFSAIKRSDILRSLIAHLPMTTGVAGLAFLGFAISVLSLTLIARTIASLQS